MLQINAEQIAADALSINIFSVADAEKYRLIISKIKERSVAASDAQRVNSRQFFYSFRMQPSVKPIRLKNILLSIKKFLSFFW